MEETNQQPMRATRFTIPMSLRYRRSGDAAWHNGKVQNISRSGVLFAAEEIMDVNTRIELTFELPIKLGGEKSAQVHCTGQVVRTIMAVSTVGTPSLAATIQGYLFSPADCV